VRSEISRARGSPIPSAAFAIHEPSSGANLNACPEPPVATRDLPVLSGSRRDPKVLVGRVAVDARSPKNDRRIGELWGHEHPA